MGKQTGISWTNHTHNPVRACTYATLPDGTPSRACVSPCYAEAMSKRNPEVLGTWGPDGRRTFGTETYLRQPLLWDRAAAKAGEIRRVFCASLADLFEGPSHPVGGNDSGYPARLVESRQEWVRSDYVPMLTRLWATIQATPHLRWQILTKRPWNMLAWAQEHGWPDTAWAGVTAEGQAEFDDRIEWLERVPAAVRFLSVEPMFERIDAGDHLRSIAWSIIGGNSAAGSAALDLGAVEDLMGQLKRAGTATFVKQLGHTWARSAGAKDRAGADPEEWPAHLQVQTFPAERMPTRTAQAALFGA